MSKDRYLYHSKHLNKDKLLQSVGSITVQSYCKSWTFVECSHLPQKLSIGNKASPKPQYLLEEVLQSTVKSVRFYSSPGGLSNSITRATCKLKGSKDQGQVHTHLSSPTVLYPPEWILPVRGAKYHPPLETSILHQF